LKQGTHTISFWISFRFASKIEWNSALIEVSQHPGFTLSFTLIDEGGYDCIYNSHIKVYAESDELQLWHGSTRKTCLKSGSQIENKESYVSGGAVAEWSKALHSERKTKRKSKDPRIAPPPSARAPFKQERKKTPHFRLALFLFIFYLFGPMAFTTPRLSWAPVGLGLLVSGSKAQALGSAFKSSSSEGFYANSGTYSNYSSE